jgi:FHA domain-containing protein
MARIFGTLLGKGRALAQARAAELKGELPQAAALFAGAGRLDEAARVMVLRGDAEPDLAQRLRHYLQAVATAPDGSSMRTHARRKHATAVVAMAADAPTTEASRRDLTRAASELEAMGDYAHAAHAYALASDIDGQARTLARAGDVEALDQLLAEQQARDREAIARRHTYDEVTLLSASGRRRDAAATARASLDEGLRERGRSLEERRVAGDIVHATVRGSGISIVLGDEIVIGRAPDQISPDADGDRLGGSVGGIVVAAAAVSRRHVAIARRNGEVVVRDLGSRNATTLRGSALSGEAAVGDGLELRLGRDVPLLVLPASEIAGAVAIEVAGLRFIAPLGPAMLGVGRWRLERGPDAWVELATDDDPPSFSGAFRLAAAITLLDGDAISAERGGPPVFTVRRA